MDDTPVNAHGPPDWPLPDAAVQAAVHAALLDGSWGRYHGPHVAGLEEALSVFHQVPHVLTCASGTLAIEVALRALQIGPGDEVILAAYEYEANFLAIHAIDAVPVLVDVDPRNANLDPEQLEAAIGPKTRAILVSHLHGGMVPMERVRAVADQHGVPVVEDAAQATGATIEGKKAGAAGDIGILSFGGSKLLTAGRGGAILVRDAAVAQRAKLWLARGIQQWAALSEIQAVVLRPQLAQLEERTAHRHRQVRLLDELLRDVPGLTRFANPISGNVPAFYKVGYFLDESVFGLSRELFVKALRSEGIAFDEGFRALHIGRNPKRFRAAGSLANAEMAHRQVVMLHHPVLSLGNDEIEMVAQAVRKTYRNAHRLRENS